MQQIMPHLISVVIQGPLLRELGSDRGVDATIASVRCHLPGAEVVVSTWDMENVDALDVDRLVVSSDPGFMKDCSGNIINTNRQLVSTLAGIKASTRSYVMKLRADIKLTSSEFSTLGTYHGNSVLGQQRLFKDPITITTLFVRNPVWFPMLYHISDLVQFGRREDMLRFWDQPLFAEDSLCLPHARINPFGNYQGFSRLRMNAEQALMIGMLRKCGIQVQLDHPCQVREVDLERWEDVLCNNFRVLDYQVSGVDFPPRLFRVLISPRTVFTVNEINRIAAYTPMQRRLRRTRVWLNQYVLCYFQLAWWVPAASIVLFSISPALARHVRQIWRKIRRNQRPLQDGLDE